MGPWGYPGSCCPSMPCYGGGYGGSGIGIIWIIIIIFVIFALFNHSRRDCI
ncbi:MAG: hypothetical protein PHI05_00970 [Bacilli bacterium]|nr:hypothetical protein [Bacilli bacterium]MDD4547300.1 hypothetical protein [Bacilli bacterium]